MRLGVLVSGSGTNLQALIDRVHEASATIAGVCSSNHEAYALERARAANRGAVFALASYAGEPARRDRAMAEWLTQRRVGLVICAGYMGVLSAGFLARASRRACSTCTPRCCRRSRARAPSRTPTQPASPRPA